MRPCRHEHYSLLSIRLCVAFVFFLRMQFLLQVSTLDLDLGSRRLDQGCRVRVDPAVSTYGVQYEFKAQAFLSTTEYCTSMVEDVLVGMKSNNRDSTVGSLAGRRKFPLDLL